MASSESAPGGEPEPDLGRLYVTERSSREAAEQAVEHIARLQAITSALSQALTADEVAKVMMGHAYNALGASAAVAYFLSPDGAGMRYVGSRGVAPIQADEWRRGTAGPVVVDTAIRDNRPIWLGTRAEMLAAFPDLENVPTAPEKLQAMVGLPLSVDRRVLGGIGFSFSRPRAFDQEERDYLLTLAELCAQALDRARLYEAERKARADAADANRRLQLLSEASKAFAEASRDLPSALDVIAQGLTEMVGDTATIALISLLSEDGIRLENVAARARDPELVDLLVAFAKEDPQRLGQGVRGRVAATGEAVFLPVIGQQQLEDTFEPRVQPFLERCRIDSMIIVPLSVQDRILGTVSMTRSAPSRPYTEADLTFIQELADRAALTIENARLYQAATRAIRVRDHFLSVAGHELLTPLTVLRLQLSSLQRKDFNPDRAAGKLEMATRSLERLDNLIDKFLDVSCISAGQLSLTPETVELGALVREVAGIFGERLARSGCELDLHTEGAVVGQWDRLRIEQVITNLFSNACKYGGGKPVEVAVGRTSEMAFVQVKDHGVGIAPADQARIFERFEHAMADRRNSGLRLGLWICREIVEALDGRITVESAPGEGSSFTVYLPVGPGSPNAGNTGSPGNPGKKGPAGPPSQLM
jgi:signal transduction histidine kinase